MIVLVKEHEIEIQGKKGTTTIGTAIGIEKRKGKEIVGGNVIGVEAETRIETVVMSMIASVNVIVHEIGTGSVNEITIMLAMKERADTLLIRILSMGVVSLSKAGRGLKQRREILNMMIMGRDGTMNEASMGMNATTNNLINHSSTIEFSTKVLLNPSMSRRGQADMKAIIMIALLMTRVRLVITTINMGMQIMRHVKRGRQWEMIMDTIVQSDLSPGSMRTDSWMPMVSLFLAHQYLLSRSVDVRWMDPSGPGGRII